MSIKVDQSGPAITCSTCVEQFSYNGTYSISGQVIDATSGVGSLTINSAPASYDPQGNFSSQLSLTVGDNPFTLLVTDVAGNSTSLQFVIHYARPKLLSVSASKPVMKNGKVSASTFSISASGKNVIVKPISNYSGKVATKQITFGDTSLYVFVPQDPYVKGAVYVYDGNGKALQILKPFGKYITTGMNVSFGVDSDSNTAWLAIGEAKGSRVAVYQITSTGVWLKTNLSKVTTKKGVSITVKWLKVYANQLGLVTMVTGKPSTMKTWKLNADGTSFTADPSVKSNRYRFSGKDVLLR